VSIGRAAGNVGGKYRTGARLADDGDMIRGVTRALPTQVGKHDRTPQDVGPGVELDDRPRHRFH
jgi:hypothetical protein